MPSALDITAFRKLTPHGQEDFLADGGIILTDKSKDLTLNDVIGLATNRRASLSVISTTTAPESGGVISSTLEGGSGSSKELEVGSVDMSPLPVDIETPPTSQPSFFTNPAQPATSANEANHPVDQKTTNQYTEEEQKFIGQWTEGFDIATPVHLLMILDDDISSGRHHLHPWQVEFMLDFAYGGHTKDNPFYAAVQAANGSGKDKYVVAACVVWLCMRYSKARGVVTNGSGAQLDSQTEHYINDLCESANLKWAGGKELIWKCTYRYYECIPTKSPITLFATDEPNKAEGYHPLKAGGKMAIFASEAKAIPDEIFGALTRCKGFTHRIDVSSPGLPIGYFHTQCTNSINRRTFDSITDKSPGSTTLYHITAFDCSHISKQEIADFADKCPSGINDPLYISGVLAQFTTTDEMVVIPYAFIMWGCKEAPKKVQWIQETFNKGGLDLSDGGAETCLVVRNGNRHLKTIPFKFQDTQDTIHFLEDKFADNNLVNKDALVFSDCCGIGKPMLDQLKSRGWSNMRYVDSRHKSSDKKVYFNRGTELFFNIRLLLERHELIVEYDKLLCSQLSGRYYKLRDGTVRQLLTKLEQKSRGYPSPDRADAFNLAFWDYKTTRTFKDYHVNAPSTPESLVIPEKATSDFSLKQWANSDTTSLESFRKNVSKHKPVTYLQRELDRYNKKN